jgi:tetratricopeptide (TPR) repeat protein
METRLGDLDWKQVPSWAWTYNLQLSLAVTRNDRAEVLNLLRRPSPAVGSSPDFRDNYQQGSRLRLLGFYHFERGDMRRSLGCFRAALRCYARDETVDARLKEIDIFGHWGKAAFREGRLSESERYLRRAIRAAGRFKYRLGYHTYRHELAHVYALGGQLERAERMALGITRGPARRGSGSGREHFLLVKCILSAGHFAVDGGEARKAARHAALARSLLEESGHPRLPGYLHLLDARVEAMGASEAAYARALEKFELAAVSFRAFGDGDMPGLSLLAYYRGHVHIQRHDVKAALAEAVECMEIAKRSGFLPARSASLLLKSQLLLQRELPNADRLYEEVLRDLGSIHDKVVLFKVIANLYLYSWELGEQLDLTDWHMKQIRRMQEILDRETFHCLYERYVTRPVFHRALVRALGHGDQSFTAPGAESSYAAP